MSNTANRIQLILIIAIPILGLLSMTGYYFYITQNGLNTGTHNKGTLIQPPKPIGHLLADDATKTIVDGSDKWTFLVINQGVCEKACEDSLYLTRQIREALGKYSGRVRNVYLSTEGFDEQKSQWFDKEYAKHQKLMVSDNKLISWLAKDDAVDASQASFFVIDPSGWVMMYYTDDNNYKEVIRDMKFLLKNS